jgi:hypothetical protein
VVIAPSNDEFDWGVGAAIEGALDAENFLDATL